MRCIFMRADVLERVLGRETLALLIPLFDLIDTGMDIVVERDIVAIYQLGITVFDIETVVFGIVVA